MIPDDQLWHEPLEDMAASEFDNRFMMYACVGLIGGFLLMMFVLGTTSLQFYDWHLTTQSKTYIGFGAMMVGAAIFILVARFLLRGGAIRRRLDQSRLSDVQQKMAFAVFYYEKWIAVRSWILRFSLLLAGAVYWIDRLYATKLHDGLEMTSPIFYAFVFYLVWAEWKFFTRLASLPRLVTAQEWIPLGLGTLATIIGFVLIMPELFGGMSFVNLRESGVSQTGIVALTVLVFGGSEWSDYVIRRLRQQSKVTEVLMTTPQ